MKIRGLFARGQVALARPLLLGDALPIRDYGPPLSLARPAETPRMARVSARVRALCGALILSAIARIS